MTMNNENYDPNTSDELERNIVDALCERQRKAQLIGEWEAADHQTVPKIHRLRLRPLVVTAAAACIALFFIFAPWHQGGSSPLDEWRQGETEASRGTLPEYDRVTHAIESENYDEALLIVCQSMEECLAQRAVVERDNRNYLTDEEKEYELRALNDNLEECLWVKICLLVQMHRFDEARKCLDQYQQTPEYKRYSEAADRMLRKIEEKK